MDCRGRANFVVRFWDVVIPVGAAGITFHPSGVLGSVRCCGGGGDMGDMIFID